MSLAPSSPNDQLSSPSRPRDGNLRRVAEVEASLREGIRSGRYPVGGRLPTETELTRSLHVSRSVLREAVAALRSEGLLKSRQGAGVFVLRDRREASPLALLTNASATISDVIEELELRTAVEIEAAGLACLRGSPAQLAHIQTCHEAFGQAARDGEPTASSDSTFHMAIAKATNNRRFDAFLAHLGERTIPRVQIKAKLGVEALAARDMDLHAEHEAIVTAILDQEVAGAREAMRAHLGGSMSRYRRLIHQPSSD